MPSVAYAARVGNSVETLRGVYAPAFSVDDLVVSDVLLAYVFREILCSAYLMIYRQSVPSLLLSGRLSIDADATFTSHSSLASGDIAPNNIC